MHYNIIPETAQNNWSVLQLHSVSLVIRFVSHRRKIYRIFRSVAATTPFFFSRFVLVRQLFEGGVYFVGKPAESNDDWNRYVRMIQLGMIDAGSSACSACSPSQSSCQLWKRVLEHEQGLEIAQWASAAIISTRVRASFEGGVYFARSYRLCGYNSREATIRGQGLVTPWMVPPQKRRGWSPWLNIAAIDGSPWLKIPTLRWRHPVGCGMLFSASV